MQDLAAGLVGAVEQRDQREPGRECRHQHGRQALQAAADDEFPPEALALVESQVDVVRDLEDAIAGRDAGERDEADHRGDRERLPGEVQRHDAADQRKWDVAHDDQGQHRRLVAGEQHHEDQRQRHQAEQPDPQRRLLLRLEGALQAGDIALRQWRLRDDSRMSAMIAAMSRRPSPLP